jgi:hypothetical protein
MNLGVDSQVSLKLLNDLESRLGYLNVERSERLCVIFSRYMIFETRERSKIRIPLAKDQITGTYVVVTIKSATTNGHDRFEYSWIMTD